MTAQAVMAACVAALQNQCCGEGELAGELEAVSAQVAELARLSGVIDAEFRSDPMAVQCFDLTVLRQWQAALAAVGGAA